MTEQRKIRAIVAAAAGAFGLLIVACGGVPAPISGGGTITETTPAAASPSAVTTVAPVVSAPPPPAPGPFVAFQDGMYEVGALAGQVKPGQYKTTVPVDSFGCYWARLKDTSGDMGSILANGVHEAGTPVVVTIKATDKAFKSNRCGEWKLS